MDETTNKTCGLSSEETLERFVIRARRVENNSLVKSGDIERHATLQMTCCLTESGDASIQHHVCTDEEAVESLATRLRPFIVKSEPIYLPKILKAIYLQAPSESLSEDEVETLKTAESWFSHRYEEKDSERYRVQLMGKDG